MSEMETGTDSTVPTRTYAKDDHVVVREHVRGWAGLTRTVRSVGPASVSRPVKVVLDEDPDDPRDFAFSEPEPEKKPAPSWHYSAWPQSTSQWCR